MTLETITIFSRWKIFKVTGYYMKARLFEVGLVRPFPPNDFSSTVAEQPDKVDQGQGQEQGQGSTQLTNLKGRAVSNVQDKAP